MKSYQITRKFQVTIPKKIAEKAGIRPGDSVVFEMGEDCILIRKTGQMRENPEELVSVIRDFASDVAVVRKRVKEAGEAMIEDLSRNIAA